MSKFLGSVIREQGVTFAIVVVKKHAIDNKIEANNIQRRFCTIFPDMPIILMAQDSHGVPTYYGRSDIARFMARVPLNAIPWKEYTLN